MDPHIFRAYDIRGRANEQLTTDVCYHVGRAFGTELKRRYQTDHPTVAIGRDARTHGPELEQAVIDGALKSGCRVLHIGQTPSPVNYFTLCDQKLDGSLQVTASHNPAHDNGIKLQIRGAAAFAGEELQQLRQQIEDNDFDDGEGTLEEYDAVTPYISHVSQLFSGIGDGLMIVTDHGNGVAGPVYNQILKNVGCTLIELYSEPDGTFPNHPADPSKHDTLKDLQQAVVEHNAALGFAYDGDGDRVGLINEKGEICTADQILLMLAEDHLSRHQNVPVVFTVSNSDTLQTEISAWGGRAVMCKVGHSFVEHAMTDSGARLGGEQSGHFFCGEDYYGFDDALVASLRILSILKAKQESISTICSHYPAVFQTPEVRPHCPDDKKAAVIASVSEHFAKDYQVETMDGARISFGDGAWAGIRMSNTSPCLSICIEARSPQKLAEVKDIVFTHLKQYPEVDL